MDYIKDLTLEFGEPIKSGISGELLFYSAKFDDLLDDAVNREIITREDANNWDVRCSHNLLNAMNIPHGVVEADEQQSENDEDYEWHVYWK